MMDEDVSPDRESCLEQAGDFYQDEPACTACGFGFNGSAESHGYLLEVGDDCPLCGSPGSIVDGYEFGQNCESIIREYWS